MLQIWDDPCNKVPNNEHNMALQHNVDISFGKLWLWICGLQIGCAVMGLQIVAC
jgi:hypothetical protein